MTEFDDETQEDEMPLTEDEIDKMNRINTKVYLFVEFANEHGFEVLHDNNGQLVMYSGIFQASDESLCDEPLPEEIEPYED